MKKLLIIFLFAGTRLLAQDTTVVLNVSLQARVIAYLAPLVASPANDQRFSVFLKWRTSLRKTPSVGTTAVVTDTIPTVILAALYNQALSNEDGLGMGTLMKAQIASKRTGNTYLDRLCTNYELLWTAILNDRIALGRKLLLGK